MSVSGVPSKRYGRRRARTIPEYVVSTKVSVWQMVVNRLIVTVLAMGSMYGMILHTQNMQLQDEVYILKSKNKKLMAAQDLKNKAGDVELKQP